MLIELINFFVSIKMLLIEFYTGETVKYDFVVN